jgi:serine/threonine-protein kinase RIO1
MHYIPAKNTSSISHNAASHSGKNQHQSRPSVKVLHAVNAAVQMEQQKDAQQFEKGTGTEGKFISDHTGSGEQVKKEEFLALLKTGVYAAANKILAQIDQNAGNCPYIVRWFAYYAGADVAHIEQAIRRFAPKSSNAATVNGYIDAIVAKVSEGLEAHVKTGSTDTVPEELIQEDHEPGNFLHVADQNETAQLSCFSKEKKAPVVVDLTDYKGIYEAATPISDMYKNVRHFQDDEGSKIIKECPQHEIDFFKTMSGTPHFPTCYGGNGNYCIFEFLGNYPDPAPTAESGQVTANLEQAAFICKAMAEHNISHGDLDNNMLFHSGLLYVIDFGAAREVSKQTALGANGQLIKRFLNKGEQEKFQNLMDT